MNAIVVLLNWNGWCDTLECLESLLSTLSADASVVVCDNASSDGSVERICEWVVANAPDRGPVLLRRDDVLDGAVPRTGQVHIVDNGGNLGFAGGNNSGVRLALNDPACSYVWLLNNDTTVERGTLPAAIARMEADPRIGICGSTLMYYHEPDSVQAFGGAVYSRWTGRSRHLGAFARRVDVPDDPRGVEAQMSYVVGASMLVRRAFVERVGYMREDYFLYCEEIDWATRGSKFFRLGYAPDSVVRHKEGASIGTSAVGGSPLSLFYLFRNRVRYAWRFHRAYVPSVLLFCGLDIAKLVLRRRWPQALAAVRGVMQLGRAAPVPSAREQGAQA